MFHQICKKSTIGFADLESRYEQKYDREVVSKCVCPVVDEENTIMSDGDRTCMPRARLKIGALHFYNG